MLQSPVPPSTTQQLFVFNYPLIFLVVVIIIILSYKFLMRQQVEASMDDGWLKILLIIINN